MTKFVGRLVNSIWHIAASIQRVGVGGTVVGIPWQVRGAINDEGVVRLGRAASLTMTGLNVGRGNRELRSRHTGEGARVHISFVLGCLQLI